MFLDLVHKNSSFKPALRQHIAGKTAFSWTSILTIVVHHVFEGPVLHNASDEKCIWCHCLLYLVCLLIVCVFDWMVGWFAVHFYRSQTSGLFTLTPQDDSNKHKCNAWFSCCDTWHLQEKNYMLITWQHFLFCQAVFTLFEGGRV